MIGKTILHYRIVKKLGQGGMGIVYLAEDLNLQRQVAVKFLPQGAVNDDEQRRFQIEARAAAALNHPNVTTIHAIEEWDGETFIVMEYVEGRELTAAGKENGGLSPEALFKIATQMADGLNAAHKAGVVHRDFKSSNILLTEDGQVKIMDFGLAMVEGGARLTREHSTLGTTAYMSPEQARGEAVDHRTDIWAYGVVLYELLTGGLPFPGLYEQAVLYAIMNEEPAPIPEVCQRQSPDLVRVITRCLQKDPDARYASCDALLEDLHGNGEAAEVRSVPGAATSMPEQRRRRGLRRTLLAGGAAVSLLVMLFILFDGGRLVKNWFSGVPDEQHLVVLPFTNIGEDAGRQALCDGLVETLTSKLSQLEQFHGSLWVVPASEVRRNRIESPGDGFKTFGANLAVTGSLQPLEDHVRLTLNLVDAQSLRQLNSAVIDVPGSQLTALQDQSIQNLLDMLRLELDPGSRGLLVAGTPSAPGAYQYYLQGRGYLQRYEDLDKVEAAISVFQTAIALDSTYALAYAGLGEAFWRKYRLTRDAAWSQRAVAVCEKAHALDSQLAEVNRALGMVHAGTGRYDEAVRAYNRALNVDPTSADAHRGLALAYERLGDIDRALQTYQTAIRLKPDYWGGYNALGVFYYRQGQYELAAEQFKQVVMLTPDNHRGYNNLAGMYYMLKRWPEAREMYEKALRLKESFSVYSNLGTLYFIEGRYAEAATMYEKAIALNERHYSAWANLASAYQWVEGKQDRVVPYYRKAIELAEEQHAVNEKDVEVLSDLATYYVMIPGQQEKARRLIQRAISLSPSNVQTMYKAIAVYELSGDRETALHWVGEALKHGQSRSEIENQPEFRDMIADARYKTLMENLDQKRIERK